MVAQVPLGEKFSRFVSGFMFEALLYGVNLILFTACVLILTFKTGGLPNRPLLASAVAIFMSSTASVSLSMYILFGVLLHGLPPPFPLVQAKHTLYLVNNVIADAMLIYRCYAVWSRSKRVIVAPCMLLLAGSIYGAIYLPGPPKQAGAKKFYFLWLTLALNISVTALIVFRIWWMARRVRKILGRNLGRKHYSGIAVAIETGFIYSVYVLIYQIFTMLKVHSFVLDVGLAQTAVIAPILIIVQAGLGRHIRDIEATIQLEQRVPMGVLSTVHSA